MPACQLLLEPELLGGARYGLEDRDQATDELVDDHVIGDDTWSQLSNHLDPQQILDLIFTAGSWAMLAWLVASLGVELDDDLRDAINAHDATLPNAVVR